jgi:hypothetical protein
MHHMFLCHVLSADAEFTKNDVQNPHNLHVWTMEILMITEFLDFVHRLIF